MLKLNIKKKHNVGVRRRGSGAMIYVKNMWGVENYLRWLVESPPFQLVSQSPTYGPYGTKTSQWKWFSYGKIRQVLPFLVREKFSMLLRGLPTNFPLFFPPIKLRKFYLWSLIFLAFYDVRRSFCFRFDKKKTFLQHKVRFLLRSTLVVTLYDLSIYSFSPSKTFFSLKNGPSNLFLYFVPNEKLENFSLPFLSDQWNFSNVLIFFLISDEKRQFSRIRTSFFFLFQ